MQNNPSKEEKKFGLFTVMMMIVGVVIGSGIFFKSGNILIATNGNIALGVLTFCIAAISIIFGSLTIAQLAERTDAAGGVIAYAEKEINSYAACAIGWYHTFLLYGTTIGVVAWIGAVYIDIIFKFNFSMEQKLFVSLLLTVFFFLVNIFASKLSTLFQTSAAIIKLIPLILIAILGFIFGDTQNFLYSPAATEATKSLSWISAIAPIAFAYEGWIVATSLSHKIKDPKKNLPIALTLAPIFILLVYVTYFVGISIYVGPENVMKMGNEHLMFAAQNLFGQFGGRLVFFAVLISVLGTLNGNIMGIIQIPYALSLRGMFPNSNKISKINDKFKSPIYSGFIAMGIALVWIVVNYLEKKFQFLGNSDVCEVVTVGNYLLYIMLYLKVINLARKSEIKSIFKGYVFPCMAIVGVGIMVYGAYQIPRVGYMFAVCIVLVLAALAFWKNNANKSKISS